ncbi:MAG TPA: 1-deoxy-D-xylulose-5-phosphate synthase [Planctomycetota bacterium]|nr:1-deoxy-D-xylulose-5-phosphate synthase [Planctomycetota bacterium]|tara:strand:+ start:48750 stop:50687 length:1938 start_codon:yes stop_codon:yes gene_type:complete
MSSLLLSEIRSPDELQGRSLEDLESLCNQMRAALVEKVLQTGGHLGSNLGVVELTVALHSSFDFLRDKLVFDVSHQCYPHKMLTGRYAEFDGLRQTEGISGFTNRFESDFDPLTAGHAGTAISFAMGLAEGLKGTSPEGEEDPWSVAFVGDSGLACGVAFEGLNQAGERKPRLIVVLNDNEWSIAKSVGAMARYLSRIRTSKTLQGTADRLISLAHKIPWLGDRIDEVGEVLRHVMVPGHVFEELGVNYVGPLDGHDLDGCMEAFRRIKRLGGVHLVHFLTEKGRGYEPASHDDERAHGVKPAKSSLVKVSRPWKANDPERKSFTQSFSDAICHLAEKDSRIIALTAAMPSGTGLDEFASRWPNRFVDTGITEQHAVALAGGMATGGKRPICAIYSTFLQRAYDQVFQEVALQEENVILALDRAGLVGQDGPTHQGLYDLAYLRTLPGIQLASPRDGADLQRMLEAALECGGPWSLRWPRGSVVHELSNPAGMRPDLIPGTAERLRDGCDGVIFALGAMVENALEAAEILSAEKIQLEVWDARFCRPLDTGALADASRRHPFIATVEEHALQGGFGSAVTEALADMGIVIPVSRHGVEDRFIQHASSREEQLQVCGLSSEELANQWRERIFETRSQNKLEQEPSS